MIRDTLFLAQASPTSTIRVTIEQSANDISIATANQSKYVPRDVVLRLFDRFYRGDAARQGEGAGLGLAIVKSIIELHRGSVAVESEQSGETRFTLRIPSVATDGESHAHHGMSPENSKRV